MLRFRMMALAKGLYLNPFYSMCWGKLFGSGRIMVDPCGILCSHLKGMQPGYSEIEDTQEILRLKKASKVWKDKNGMV